MNAALARFSRRHERLRPGRTLLTLLSVVIGVSAVAAVDMLSNSIRSANQRMFATVNGASSLEISGPGNLALEESLVAEVEKVSGVQAAVPVVQRPAVLFTGDVEHNQRTRLYAMGVDPARDGALRDHEIVDGRFVQDGDEVVLEQTFARTLEVKLGDEVRLLGGRGRHVLTVVGFLKTTAHARTSAGSLLFLPLKKAQEIFLRGKHQVDTVQVVFHEGAPEAKTIAAIEQCLPIGITARKPAGRTAVLEQTMFATERGLDVSAKFTALLGAFIVFNTFLMNVSERRRQLAILRAIGATQWQIASMLLREGLFLGVLGTLIGFLCGWQGTQILSRILSEQLSVEFPIAQLTPLIAVKSIAFGLGMSLLGVIYPTWQASRLTPLEGMRSVAKEDVGKPSWTGAILGCGITFIGGAILKLTLERKLAMERGTDAAILMLIGIVLVAAPFLGIVSRSLAALLRPGWGTLASLAQRQLARHRMRTTLTAGVLFMAAATGLGMSYAILDAVQDIRDWYKHAIVGDFFVRAMLPDFATGLSPELPETLGDDLREVRGIASLDTARFTKTKANGVDCIAAARDFPTDADLTFDLISGDRGSLKAKLEAGEVVVSSVLAQKANVDLGDRIALETTEGVRKVRIAAINNEYAFGGLTVWMHRSTGEKLLAITGVDAYVIRAEAGQVDAVQEQLEPICRKYELLLHSFRDIRHTIDGIIAGTDFGLWVLVLLGFVVASFGVVNTLTMNVLEQTRELGMLRIVAMTRNQVRRLIVAQALLLGLLGIIPGVLFGCVIAYLMNIAATVSLAHPIEFGFHPALVFGTFFGGIGLVVLSALIPAYRASRINVLQSLQYE